MIITSLRESSTRIAPSYPCVDAWIKLFIEIFVAAVNLAQTRNVVRIQTVGADLFHLHKNLCRLHKKAQDASRTLRTWKILINELKTFRLREIAVIL